VLQQVKGRLFESQADRQTDRQRNRERERERERGGLEIEKLLCRSEHNFDFTRNVI
jgi:hypothetical protein